MLEKNFPHHPRLKKLLDFKPLGGTIEPQPSNQMDLFSDSFSAKYRKVMACGHKTGKIKLEFIHGQLPGEKRNSPSL